MIMVAGDRVATDVVAVPFSKARNCVHLLEAPHRQPPRAEETQKNAPQARRR